MGPMLSILLVFSIVGVTTAGAIGTMTEKDGAIDTAFDDIRQIYEVENQKAEALARFTGRPVESFFHKGRLTPSEIDDRQERLTGTVNAEVERIKKLEALLLTLETNPEPSASIENIEALREIIAQAKHEM